MSKFNESVLMIMERGGYPNFCKFFNQLGYEVTIETTMRKALSRIKRQTPKIVIAEFNFQTDFRDRTSSLESLMATLQRYPLIKVIVFYEKEHQDHFNRLAERYDFDCILKFPISETMLNDCVSNIGD